MTTVIKAGDKHRKNKLIKKTCPSESSVYIYILLAHSSNNETLFSIFSLTLYNNAILAPVSNVILLNLRN